MKLPLPLFLVTVTRTLLVPHTVDEAAARVPPFETAKAVPNPRAWLSDTLSVPSSGVENVKLRVAVPCLAKEAVRVCIVFVVYGLTTSCWSRESATLSG